MEIINEDLNGAFLIKPTLYNDNRGYFKVAYNKNQFESLVNSKVDFVQDNESYSQYGTLRGLHFQSPPFAQAKLVQVTKGKVLDVIVDLRSSSSTYKLSKTYILSEDNHLQLFVPKGFAHGFVVLSDYATFNYKVDNIYHPQSESGIIWNDNSLSIDWGINKEDIILSEKDKSLTTLDNYAKKPLF